MNKSLNDKGSTLITVVISLAVIGTLAVAVLWVSIINYQMKITDSDVKDNFYSAETVLDQIKTGLQKDVSEAYLSAYTDVMQNYTSYTKDERATKFGDEYISSLREKLRSDSGTDRKFSLSTIKSYVDEDLLDTSTTPYAIVETTIDASDSQADGLLTTYESKLVIKGLKVTYVDSKGLKSIIETDIALGIPEMNFKTAADMPEIFSYSIIANTGIEAETGKTNIKGSVYAGSPYTVDTTNDGIFGERSFLLDSKAEVNIEDGKYFIAKGTIDTSVASSLSVGSDTQVWTQNIIADTATVTLKGNTYVSDDLTLSGSSPKVYLGDNSTGKYVGYGNDSTEAGKSSAIIINGKDSVLDMSGLDELFVAGYSFIQSSAYTNDVADNSDVLMGESISLKGNQIAYLVPGECIGTDSTGASLYDRNPLTYTEYKKIAGDSTYSLYDDSVVSAKTGHALSYYLDDGEKLSDCISTVFVPGSSGKKDDTLVYFYISLSSDKASKYYSDYFTEDSSKLDLYSDFYANVIKSNDSASKVYTAGNYSLYENGTLSLLGESEESKSSVADEITSVSQTYMALYSTLTTNYSNENGQLSKTVFDNIIATDNLTTLTAGTASGKKVVSYTDSDGTVYDAVLINKSGYKYNYNSESQEGGKIRLIVTTGDVEIRGDFTGTIIALGKIYIDGGSVSIANEDIDTIRKLLNVSASDDLKLSDVFVDGDAYLESGLTGDGTTTDEDIDYADIIVYENWTKE